jgi:hypothetical protein
VDRDEHLVGFLAQWVAADQAFCGEPGAVDIAGRQPLPGDDRQGVLVAVGESLSLSSEAVVTQALGEVAAVRRDRRFGRTRRVVGADLEASEIQGPEGLRPQSERLGIRLQDSIEVGAGGGECRPQLVQRLAERSGRGPQRFGPKVGGDRLARPRSAGQREQCEQGLRVASDEAYFASIRGPDAEATE